jgi:hypothetical protein
MKKSTLTIAFEQEKLDALCYFTAQRGTELQDELDAFLMKLYEKYVPEPTRKYIESKPASLTVSARIPKPRSRSDEHSAV